jgi:phosphoribosylanthranilate isomerase
VDIKICGMTNEADALLAARLGADFVGLILAASPRRASLEVAAKVVATLPPATQPVLVFRDAPLDEVVAALAATRCGWVQLHGDESAGYIDALRKHQPAVHVIKAWAVSSAGGGDELIKYLRDAAAADVRLDVVLLDAPKDGAAAGFEELGAVSRRIGPRPPAVWCAGGLDAGNVGLAVAAGQYNGVDVARGVERQAGAKDPARVREFIEAVRGL